MASLTKVKINNIDTSIEYFADPLVLLNFGSTLANTDIGFIFNRDGGISPNVALYWNETTDKVTIAYTSATGLPNSNIALTKYANVAADWYFGNLAGGTTNTVWVSANVLPTANAFYNFGSPTQRWNVGYFAATTLDLGGSQISVDPTNGFKFVVGGTGTPTYLASNGLVAGTTISTSGTLNVGTSAAIGTNLTVGGFINTAGNVLATGGVFNSMRVNGNDTVTGFLNVSGNILSAGAVHNALAVNGTTTTQILNSTGNILATGGVFNALTLNGSLTSTGFLNTTANLSAAIGNFGAINSTGLINTTANISASTFSGGQIYVSGLVNAGGNVLAQIGIFNELDVNGNIVVGSVGIPGAGHSIIGNIIQSGAGTVFFNTPGNISAALGNFGAINSTGYFNTSGNISTAQLNTALVNSTGNILATGAVLNSLTVNGGVTSTGFINTTANVSAAVGLFGSINSTGFINTSGNVSAATLIAGQISTSGNLLSTGLRVFGNTTIGLAGATSGQFHSIIGNITQTSSGGAVYINTSGNVMAAIGQFGAINSTGFINTSGNVSAAVGSFGSLNSTGLINTSGNVSAATVIAGAMNTTGTLTAALVNSTGNILATGGVFNSLQVNGNETITGFLNISGNILGTGAILNSLTVNGNQSVTGFLNVTGNILALTADVGGLEATGIVYANSTATTTTSTSGAVRIAGGTGIGGNAVIAGILTAGRTTGVNVANFTDTVGAFYGTANSWVQLGIQNASTAIGASTDFIAYANNGDNNTGWIDMGITGQNYVNQNGQYAITGPNDGYVFMSAPTGTSGGGNLVIATGNTGVYNDIVIATGGFDTIHEQARFIDGVGLKLIQGTASINPSTGALIVQGGVGIGGNLNVQGDISLNGNLILTGNAITFNTNNLSISDSLIFLATNNSADILDIGIVGQFANPGIQHNGFVRDATDGTWKLFANVVAEPTTTVDFTNATYSNLKIGNLSAVSAGFDGNVTAAYYIGTIGTPAQPVITSLGTLTSLTASGLINTSGNVLAAGAVLNALTVNGGITSTGFINTSGNVSAAVHTGGAVSVTGFINTSGNISTAQLNAGQINTSGNVLSTSLSVFGNTSIGLTGAISGQFHSIIGNITQTTSGGAVYINTSGNVMAAVGQFGSVTSTGLINTSGNVLATGAVLNSLTVNGGVTSTGLINTLGNVLATAGTFNALTVNGGVTSTGFINTSGNISGARVVSGTGAFSGTLLAGELFVTTVGGDEGGQINLGPAVTNNTLVGNVIIDIFQNRLRIFEGGGTNRGGYFDISGLSAGVGTNLAAGGGGGTPGGGPNQLQFNQASTFAGAASLYYYGANGAVVSNAGISSTSTTTGSFQISGGVGITENINAGGSITASGAINTAGNLLASQVSAGSVITTGVVNAGGNVLARVGIFNELDVNGNIVVGLISVPGAGHSIVGNITQSGAGTIFYNTSGNILAANIAAGTVAADFFNSLNNGNGTNFKVGDDAWIGDVNTANTLGIKGQQDGTQGYIRFGNVNANALGVNGSGPLSWGGALNISGNILATGAVLNSLTVNGGVTSTGYINTSANISAAIGSFGTLIVGSTTVVTNLNADLWDGNHFASYLNQAVLTSSTPTFAGVNSTGNVLATGAVLNSLTVNGGVTSTGTVTAAVLNSTGNVLATGAILNALTINGTTNTQTVQPLASNTYTLGTTTAWYSKAFTKSAVAQYADLAENYTSDSDYAPGTVLVFGGESEVTISTQSHDTAVAGVVSTNPAYHMNALTKGVAVALQGRVPCQVRGPVRKGDRVVASDIPGVAQRLVMASYEPGCIIGKALEDINDDSVQSIEVVVGRL